MIRSVALALAVSIAGSAPAQEPAKPNPWFAVPKGAVFTTGDTWTYAGETHRLYGVQACLRGTHFTNGSGARIDCGEASLTMLVALVRDLSPLCYSAGWQAASKTRFVVCVAQPSQGAGAGARIDLGTALISSGWAFAAVNPAGAAVHEPYLIAQAVARKERLGLWQFPDMPDPNAIILRQIRAGTAAAPGAPLPAPPPVR